jgi:hypothetical protein
MPSGTCSSTQSSCMHMNTASSFHSQTAFYDEFFPGFLHTPPITRKSLLFQRFNIVSADKKSGVLLASIKYLAQCPCPRCLIKKDQIHNLGTKFDSQRRDEIREDDLNRKGDIEMTRSWIFEKGRGILSAAVERVLSPMSLVPTRVRLYLDFLSLLILL